MVGGQERPSTMKGLVPCSLELGSAHSPLLAHLAVRCPPEGERQLPAHFPLEGGGVFGLGEKSWGPGLVGQVENTVPIPHPSEGLSCQDNGCMPQEVQGGGKQVPSTP